MRNVKKSRVVVTHEDFDRGSATWVHYDTSAETHPVHNIGFNEQCLMRGLFCLTLGNNVERAYHISAIATNVYRRREVTNPNFVIARRNVK